MGSIPRETVETVLESKIAELIAPLGYDVAALECVKHGPEKKLLLYVDRIRKVEETSSPIGIEDCVRVSKTLDEPLEKLPELEEIFSGKYTLEVSSPGLDRPLRKERDFERFLGQLARIQLFRPLTAQELGNSEYQSKNPKQKKFLGKLVGLKSGRVHLTLEERTEVTIPLDMISKANLEPTFEVEKGQER